MVYIICGAVVASFVVLVLFRGKMAALLTWLVGSFSAKVLLGGTDNSEEQHTSDSQSPKNKEKNKSKRAKARQPSRNNYEEPFFSTTLSTPIEDIIAETLLEEANDISRAETKKKSKSSKQHANKSEEAELVGEEEAFGYSSFKGKLLESAKSNKKKPTKVDINEEVQQDDIGFSFTPARQKGKRNKGKKILDQKTQDPDLTANKEVFKNEKDDPRPKKSKQAVIETVPVVTRRFSNSFEKLQNLADGNRIEEKSSFESVSSVEYKESKKVSPRISYASVVTNTATQLDYQQESNCAESKPQQLSDDSSCSSIEVLNEITTSKTNYSFIEVVDKTTASLQGIFCNRRTSSSTEAVNEEVSSDHGKKDESDDISQFEVVSKDLNHSVVSISACGEVDNQTNSIEEETDFVKHPIAGEDCNSQVEVTEQSELNKSYNEEVPPSGEFSVFHESSAERTDSILLSSGHFDFVQAVSFHRGNFTADSSKHESLIEFIELEKKFAKFDQRPSLEEEISYCDNNYPVLNDSFSEAPCSEVITNDSVFFDLSNRLSASLRSAHLSYSENQTPPDQYYDIVPKITENGSLFEHHTEDLENLNDSRALSEIRKDIPLELCKALQQSTEDTEAKTGRDSPSGLTEASEILPEVIESATDQAEKEILAAGLQTNADEVIVNSEDISQNKKLIYSKFIEEAKFVRQSSGAKESPCVATSSEKTSKLSSETMQQARVLTLNDQEHQESTLYRIQKEWILEFRVGPSLFGRKVFLYCNYPEEKAEFKRNKYQLLEWVWDEGCENADDTAAFAQVKARLAGSFHYFFTYKKGENFERHGSGYFLVDPVLKHGNDEDLPLDCIQCQTVLTKSLGSFSRWENKLRVAKESGYNMIHFTPIQELGESNSSYSLSDQLELNPIFKKDDGSMPTFDEVEEFVSKLRREWKVSSICDIVLNHTANNSKWIQAHPEATYNCFDCPYMRPAYLLDAALHQFSMDVKKGLYEHVDLPAEVNSHQHLNAIRYQFRTNVLEPLNLAELYICDVNKLVAEFLALARVAPPVTERERDQKERLVLIQDPEYRRLASTVDMDLALRLYNVYWLDTFDEESRLKRCAEELKKTLDSLNDAVTEEVNGYLNVAVDNVIAGINYHRVNPDGPRHKEITKSTPLVYRYFTDYGTPESLKDHEKIMYGDKGRFLMAHNGWVMDSDPLTNFAAKGSTVYIKRELIAWGDSVKLRFGDKPEDSPFLWQRMREYVEGTARIFDGVRLDNCHSTPIPVAEYLLDCARKVRPDLYVVAELFTNSDMTDNIFVNRLGITSLIREAMAAWDSHEQGRLVYRYGGTPVGSFHQPPTRPLAPSIAHALFLDQTHDNPSPVEKRSVFDLLPSAALVGMACCASGSTRGYDELVPHHVHVVDERREYAEWGDEAAEKGTGVVSARSGLIGVKRAINELHYRLGKEGFEQVFVDQMDPDVVAVTRHCPDTHQSYILVAFTAFRHPDLNAENHQKDIRPVRIEGEVVEVVLEASMSHVNKKSGGARFSEWHNFEKDSKYINGLSEYEVSMKQHIDITESDVFNKVDSGVHNVTQLDFKNFKPGSIVIIRVTLPQKAKNAVTDVRGLIDKFSLKKQTDLSAIINTMTLADLNRALYRCDQEERDEGFDFDTYNIPSFGPMVYAGLQGFMSLLSKIRPSNDLGHPMCQNLRDGNWMIDYIWKRLKLDQGTKELGCWMEDNTKCFTDIPRYLVPCYFDLLVTGIYVLLMERCFNSMNDFVKNGSSFTRGLALGSVQFGAYIKSATLPTLSPNLAPPKPPIRISDNGEVVQACVSLSAGLPHFSVGYMRNWGRDTFIALRGLFILTGRYQESREHILGYAACLSNGLIPNLLDGGRKPRYNCRDAVWWWLYCIKEYVNDAPNGVSILNDVVSRAGVDDSPLCDVMQEALNTHFQGLKFRERNAGREIDEHMTDQGFNVHFGVHPETGFVFGGNQWNCGTWMDKMGSSDKAGNRGKPATPRDGSAVEVVGLSKSVITWLAKLGAEKKYPYTFVERTHKNNKTTRWTFAEWSDKIQANFEKYFWVNSVPTEGEIRPDLVNKRGIYKDCYGASQEWTDFQLRCNFPIAMVAAPELFTPVHAWEALTQAEKYLLGPLGMKTLDPEDWAYRGYYDNSNDSNDPTVANGFNYHQGPEWVWPIGFFLRAKLIFAAQNANLKETLASVKLILSKHFVELQTSDWRGLPELTNANGGFCAHSSRTQAWSMSSILEVLHDLQKIESSISLLGN